MRAPFFRTNHAISTDDLVTIAIGAIAGIFGGGGWLLVLFGWTLGEALLACVIGGMILAAAIVTKL